MAQAHCRSRCSTLNVQSGILFVNYVTLKSERNRSLDQLKSESARDNLFLQASKDVNKLVF